MDTVLTIHILKMLVEADRHARCLKTFQWVAFDFSTFSSTSAFLLAIITFAFTAVQAISFCLLPIYLPRCAV